MYFLRAIKEINCVLGGILYLAITNLLVAITILSYVLLTVGIDKCIKLKDISRQIFYS
jgi:hypothetical protein